MRLRYSLVLLLVAAPLAARGQTAADSAAIRAAANDYLDGFYLGDSTLHLRSIRPEVYKYGYYRPADSTSYRGMQMQWGAFQNFTRGVKEGRIKTPPDAPKTVQLLDVQDQTGAVRVDAYWGSDYILLGKHDGRWMIGHVIWQSPPKGHASVFAPASVSVGNVYRGAFDPDGRTFYYFKKTGAPASEDYTIFRTRLVDARWTAPERVHLGDSPSDLYPSISPDGRRMVFASYRPAPGDTAAGRPNAYLWYAERSGDGWGAPVFMSKAAVFGAYHPQPYFGPEGALSPDGSFLIIVAAAMDHALRRRHPADLYVSFRTGNDWSSPRPLGGAVNTAAVENFPSFSPDGTELYFVRDYGRVHRVRLAEVLGGR